MEEMTDEKRNLLNKLESWLQQAVGGSGDAAYRDTAIEDLEFYALKQDDAATLAKLDSLKRPASVYDEVRHKIDAIIAQFHAVTEAPAIEPVASNDTQLDELMTSVLKYFRRRMDILDVEHECAEYMTKTGLAYQYFYVDKMNPMKPQLKNKYVPGFNVYKDPRSTAYDMLDARFIFFEKWLSDDEMEDNFPGTLDLNTIKEGATQGSIGGVSPSYYSTVRDVYRVVECYYRKSIEVVYYVNPVNQKDDWASPEDWEKIKDALIAEFQIPEEELQFMPGRKSVVHYAIFSDNIIIEEGICPYWFCKEWGYFPLVQYGAYKDDSLNRYFGAITALKDPQRVFNTLVRQLTHLLQTAPRGILMHEIGAILNIDDYEQRSADPTYHMEVQQGGLDKVKFSNQPQISPIYESLIAKTKQGMKDTSGVQDSMLGIQTSSREPGVTAEMRQNAGIAILTIIFSNYHKSRKIATRILLSLIQQYVTEPMLIRITGQDGAQLLQINTQNNPELEGFNDITALEYDLAVEDYPDKFSNSDTTLKLLADFGMNNPGTVPLELMLQFMPIADSLKQQMLAYRDAQQEAQRLQLEAEAAAKAKPTGGTK